MNLVRSLVDDLPPEIWDIRLDVAHPMFLLFWAMVLGRGVPPLVCGWPCLATRCMQRSIVLGGAHFGDRGRPFWRCSDGLCVSHV